MKNSKTKDVDRERRIALVALAVSFGLTSCKTLQAVTESFSFTVPTPTATPFSTATPSPTPTATPVATATPTPTSTPVSSDQPYTTGSGVTSYRPQGTTGANYGYIEYIPQGYAAAAAGTYPLVIFLHGIGERGNGSLDSLTWYRGTGSAVGVQYNIDRGKYYNAVVLTPQSAGWWDSNYLNTFLTYALAAYKVNPKRVLVTGLSMGGGGTWDFISSNPTKFAAAIPICGASYCSGATQGLVSANVKVWSFHAYDDGTVGVGNSFSCMNQIGTALGQVANIESAYNATTTINRTAHFNNSTKRWEFEDEVDCENNQGQPWSIPICQTIYRYGGHFIWGQVYQHQTDAPMLWLLKQRRP